MAEAVHRDHEGGGPWLTASRPSNSSTPAAPSALRWKEPPMLSDDDLDALKQLALQGSLV